MFHPLRRFRELLGAKDGSCSGSGLIARVLSRPLSKLELAFALLLIVGAFLTANPGIVSIPWCPIAAVLPGGRQGFYHWHVRDGGISVELSDGSTYRSYWTGCFTSYTNMMRAQHIGYYASEGKDVRLTPLSPGGYYYEGDGVLLYSRVQVGSRRYLVRPEQMLRFLNFCNLGVEPCRGGIERPWFFLHKQDWGMPNVGQVDVPAEFRKYVLRSPVAGAITRIDGDRVHVSLGLGHGIHKGMELAIWPPDDVGGGWDLGRDPE